MASGQSCTASTDNVKEKENPTVTNGKIPQKGARVAYKLFDDDQEQEATIIGHAGRAAGRNKFWFNIQKEDKSIESLNFEALEHWKELLLKKYCCMVFLIRLMLKKLNYENFKVGSITMFMLKFPVMVRNTYPQDGFSQKNLSMEIRQQKLVLLQEALKKTILPNCAQIHLLVEKKVSGL